MDRIAATRAGTTRSSAHQEESMAKLKLTYFDFHGGRGEPARLALAIGGIVFEDDRVAFADWGRRKANTPFGGLPLLEVDGEIIAQSNGINRYVGKLAGHETTTTFDSRGPYRVSSAYAPPFFS